MILDATAAYVNAAVFTPRIVIEEPEGRTSGSSTISQSVEPQRWPKLKTTPTDFSEISTIESEENNDILEANRKTLLNKVSGAFMPRPHGLIRKK